MLIFSGTAPRPLGAEIILRTIFIFTGLRYAGESEHSKIPKDLKVRETKLPSALPQFFYRLINDNLLD